MSTAEEATRLATALLGPGAKPYLSDESWTWDVLLPSAVTLDEDGRLPSAVGWKPSYDPHWLAGLAAQQLARWSYGSGATVKLSVDGDSIERREANWGTLAQSLFRSSPLYVISSASGMEVDLSTNRPSPSSKAV